MSHDSKQHEFTNALAQERSPYLLQHAHNPVDWLPWSESAFQKAKSLNRPIFLSIGYSTCHWCHVMERESFEDVETAQLLNENFVSIKVDREERPDVDRIYMSFLTAMTGSGGWPLSVFLTPDLQPITAGTYFPPTDHYNRPGFRTVLRLVHGKWQNSGSDIVEQSQKITETLRKMALSQQSEPPASDVATRSCLAVLTSSFDEENGGFGDAPKFPKASDLEFLLWVGATRIAEKDGKKALEMLYRTLDKIQMGGIHDVVGHGFHRYSVDATWHIPHFEKMLYDQGQLLFVYADYCRLTGGRFADVLVDIVQYLEQSLSHKDGGFFAAEDADSLPEAGAQGKKEGAFCVWTKAEVEEVLANEKSSAPGKSLADVAALYYSIRPEGNAPPYTDPHDELKERNVLHMHKSHSERALELGTTEDALAKDIAKILTALRQRRSTRPLPHLDAKLVTAWQGLAISGLAKAGAALNRVDWIERAKRCVDFVRSNLTAPDGRLLRCTYGSRDGALKQISQPIHGFCEDYAYLIQGLLDLYDASGAEDVLHWASDLQGHMDNLMWDTDNSTGYFSAPAGDKSCIVRMLEYRDGAEPSPNAVAAHNLVRLARLLDSDAHKKRAQQIFEGAGLLLAQRPFAVARMVVAFDALERSYPKVVVVGNPEDPVVREWLSEIRRALVPNVSAVVLDPAGSEWLCEKNEELAMYKEMPSPCAMICRDDTCGMPIFDKKSLLDKIATIAAATTAASNCPEK